MIVMSCKGSEVKVKVGVGRGKLNLKKNGICTPRRPYDIYSIALLERVGVQVVLAVFLARSSCT